ncbi:hypothetical protein DVA76_18860, partial [Acinetobacter baumannii]
MRAPDGDIRLSQPSFPKVSAVSKGDLKGHSSHTGTFPFCSLEPGLFISIWCNVKNTRMLSNNASYIQF